MREFGKWLAGAGAVLLVAGCLLWLTGGMRFWEKLGRLPGDFSWEKNGVSVHMPLMTCLILSVVLTVVRWLLRR